MMFPAFDVKLGVLKPPSAGRTMAAGEKVVERTVEKKAVEISGKPPIPFGFGGDTFVRSGGNAPEPLTAHESHDFGRPDEAPAGFDHGIVKEGYNRPTMKPRARELRCEEDLGPDEANRGPSATPSGDTALTH